MLEGLAGAVGREAGSGPQLGKALQGAAGAWSRVRERWGSKGACPQALLTSSSHWSPTLLSSSTIIWMAVSSARDRRPVTLWDDSLGPHPLPQAGSSLAAPKARGSREAHKSRILCKSVEFLTAASLPRVWLVSAMFHDLASVCGKLCDQRWVSQHLWEFTSFLSEIGFILSWLSGHPIRTGLGNIQQSQG